MKKSSMLMFLLGCLSASDTFAGPCITPEELGKRTVRLVERAANEQAAKLHGLKGGLDFNGPGGHGYTGTGYNFFYTLQGAYQWHYYTTNTGEKPFSLSAILQCDETTGKLIILMMSLRVEQIASQRGLIWE